LDYEKAGEAFSAVDGTNFGGMKLYVCFSKSSIVTEDVYKKQCSNVRFNFTLNTSQQETGQH